MQRGIFPFNPILLFSSIGWFFLPNKNRKFFFIIGVIIVSWFCLMCSWKSLQGGYCWGNRLLIPILPLILLPLAFLPMTKIYNQLILSIFIVSSLVIQFSTVCTKTHEASVLCAEIHSQTKLTTPPQLPATLRLYWYKLNSDSKNIPASTIGVSSNKCIDLSNYESFYAFNLWPIHALKFFGHNSYCYRGSLAMVTLLVIIIFFLFQRNLLSYIFPRK